MSKTAIDENRQPGQWLLSGSQNFALMHGPMIGHLFETVVISEWIKAFYHRGEKPELFYWRSKDGLEIDLIIDRNQRLFPLETKASATLLPGHATAWNKWRNLS